jgi:hypothetical protein
MSTPVTPDYQSIPGAIGPGTPILSSNPNTNTGMTDQQLQSTADQYRQQMIAATQAKGTGSQTDTGLPDWLMKPLEWVGSKLYSVYTNAVSHPVTTALLATGDLSNNGQGSVFSGATWDRAYADAKHVSPGQVLYANFVKDPSGSSGYETGINKDGTLIWDHPDQVQSLFNHGAAMWATGGLDAAFSWYADPIVLAGKVAGGAKASALNQGAQVAAPTLTGKAVGALVETAPVQAAKSAITGAAGGIASRVGISDEAQLKLAQAWDFSNSGKIQQNLNGSVFNQFGDYIEQNKTRLGDQFSAWAAQQKWARQGGNASGVAAAFANATSRDDIDQILKVSLGDQSAIGELHGTNAELEAQLKGLAQSQDMWTNALTNTVPNSLQATQIQNHLQSVADDLTAIDKQTGAIGSQLAVANQMEKGLAFNATLSPTAARISQGVSKAYTYGDTSLLYNNVFVRPVRMINKLADGWNAVRPKGWVALDDPTSYREVDAELRTAAVHTPAERSDWVSQYINAPRDAKKNVLMQIEASTLGRMAANSGLTEDQAKQVYQVFNEGRANAMGANANVYGAATIEDAAGNQIQVDHQASDGSLVVVHPVFKSQLENNHPMLDFGRMKQILKYNGSAFQKLIDAGKPAEDINAGSSWNPLLRPGLRAQRASDAANEFSDLFNHMWKFQAHLRLGYGPRALSDDFLGQVAMLGASSMASRIGNGLYGQAARAAGAANSRFLYDSTGYDAKILNYDSGIAKLTSDLADAIPSQKAGVQSQLDALKVSRAQLTNSRAKLADKQIITPGGQVVQAVGEGAEGHLYVDLNSGKATVNSAMGGTAASTLGDLRGNNGWKIVGPSDPTHLNAWMRTVQHFIGNDEAGRMAAAGATREQLEAWFRGAGRDYYKSLYISNMTQKEMADRIVSEVDHVLPQTSPAFQKLRDAVANQADDKTVSRLMGDTEQAWRKPIAAEQTAYGMGKGSTIQAVDKAISKWYGVMAEKPANVLSRNPLFATLYRGHVQDMIDSGAKQGMTAFTNDHLDQMASAARKLALQDVKKFTYNMDFETKITHAMRFGAPFFGPMQEAFNRWGRILAEKPDVLGRAAQLYTSPTRMGDTTTYDGQPIVNGYAIDPSTGKKYLVSKVDTYIRFQLPKVVKDAFGLGATPVAQIPLNSLNIAMQNDPWYNPGAGPIVQMAANHFAVKADPSVGDFLTKIGILPQGITAHDSDILWGGVIRSINKSNDDGTSQKMTMQAFQEEMYRYNQGLRTTAPTMAEAKDRAQQFVGLKAWFSGTTVLPFGISFQDPYQFYRDQYKTMQAANPQTADQNFYNKYGSSAYAFTASLNKNNIPGIPATVNGQRAAAKFKDLIDQNPDLAGIIIGDQGAGKFSQTAYTQQVISGQRTKMTAAEAIDKNQANLGWNQYTAYMNGINSQLFQRGLMTLNDKGAEDLLAQKRGFVKMLSSVYMPDGSTRNPYYNQQWTEAYNTTDPSKADRTAANLADIVTASELQGRPDIQALQQYLNLRASVKTALALREGTGVKSNYKSAQVLSSGSITATKNQDLKAMFQNGVMQLIEGNTYFQTLHDKYLSKDMFDHYDGTGLVNSVTGQA